MVAEAAFAAPKKWTYDEVSHDEEHPVECYDGELFDMSSPTIRHQTIVGQLYAALLLWSREHGGRVFVSPIDLLVAPSQFLVPDLCFYAAARAGQRIEREDGRCLVAPPDLIVEVVSPSTARNDRVRKIRIYADFKVENYWIIEPERGTLEAFRLQDQTYFLQNGFTDEDVLKSPLFPGLELSLQTLFSQG